MKIAIDNPPPRAQNAGMITVCEAGRVVAELLSAHSPINPVRESFSRATPAASRRGGGFFHGRSSERASRSANPRSTARAVVGKSPAMACSFPGVSTHVRGWRLGSAQMNCEVAGQSQRALTNGRNPTREGEPAHFPVPVPRPEPPKARDRGGCRGIHFAPAKRAN